MTQMPYKAPALSGEQIVGEVKSQRETSEFYEPDEQVQLNIDQRH